MAKTRLDLANRVLVKLLVTGSGQSPDSEDTQTVDGVFDAFSEFLSEANIYTIADDQDIQLSAFEPLADYLAWFVAPDFGKPQDDGMRQRSEYLLSLITSSRPTYEALQSEYF